VSEDVKGAVRHALNCISSFVCDHKYCSSNKSNSDNYICVDLAVDDVFRTKFSHVGNNVV
jgi:hypothetical protein